MELKDNNTRRARDLLSLYIQDYDQAIFDSGRSIGTIIIVWSLALLIASCCFVLHYKTQLFFSIGWMIAPWIFLFVAFVMTFFGYYLSISHNTNQVNKAYAAFLSDAPNFKPEQSKLLRCMNVLSCISFCLGSFLTFVFILVGLVLGC